jgi:hypothetical protein
MSLTARLLEDGFVPINLKAGNVKPGDEVVNRNDMFGTLLKITKKGNYVVRYDIDYADDKPTKYTAQEFERFFLVDKR